MYAYSADIWPLLASLVFMAVLGAYAWWRRSVPGAKPFAIACLFLVLWLAAAIAEATAVTVSAKITWYSVQAVCQLPVATAMACFVLEYAGFGRWLTRRNVILLSIPPLLASLLILTNNLHRSLYTGFAVDGSVQPLIGTVGWILLAYGWGLVLVNITVFVWLFIRSPQHRWPVALMVFGQIVGRGLYLVDIAKPSLVSPLDPLILAVWFPFIMYAIALFGFHIFDPLPTARQTVIEQMREGMVVFDTRWRVASLNPAAVSILGTPPGHARGKTLQEILPAVPDLRARLAETGADPLEISLGTGADARPETASGLRYYAPDLSPLRDHRGLIIGYLLLLRDVTEHKQAEAALRESEEKLRLIFENAFDGIAVYEEYPDTGERRILECNERYAQMSGRSKKELLEIGDTALVQKSLAPVSYAKPRREVEAAQSEGFFSWVRPDGRENIIEYSAASIRVGGGLLTIGLDRDVTERKQAEARLLQQQWAQATLQERELLADELHDGLSQNLAFLNLQAQAAQVYLQIEQEEAAQASLARLAEAARQLQGDMRELIGNLLAVSLPSEGFCTTLRQVVARFEEQNSLHVRLEIADDADALCDPTVLPPDAAVQLIRVVQEALANVRKHAGRPSQIGVRLKVEAGQMQLAITDNGAGFDPNLLSAADKHFGLQVMRQRAARIGGQIAVDSAPGQGTRVEVSVPVRG